MIIKSINRRIGDCVAINSVKTAHTIIPPTLMQKTILAHLKRPRRLLQTRMVIYCSRCTCQCNGKLRIEVRKDKEYPFCQTCFNAIQFKSMKIIKEIIKLNTRAKPIVL